LPPKPTEGEEKKAEARLEPKPESQPEPKREPEPEPKPELQPEAKSEPPPEAKPEPPQETKLEPTQEAAAQPAEPTPSSPPEKTLEKVLPPVEQPAAPLTMRDFVKVLPPPPAPSAPPPSPPAPRPPPTQWQPSQPQPSPLSKAPQQEQQQASTAPSVSAFQNPAATYSHARIHEDYLVSIARRMSQYRYVPPSTKGLSSQGVVVLSLVVARDGRLISSAIAKSSGNPPMDAAVLETAQKAAPYGPLPPEISGSTVSFTLSVPFKFVAGQ
jgi:TonB family protein